MKNREWIDRFYNNELKLIFDHKMYRRNLESLQEINRAYRTYLDMDPSQIHSMEMSGLLARLRKEEEPDTERMMILSHLLKEEADLEVLQNHIRESEPLYARSLDLFLAIYRADPDFNFEKHMGILLELENKVPRDYLDQESYRIIDDIYDRWED